jgi:hypothetical protein
VMSLVPLELKAAAMLHDVLEDTELTALDLQETGISIRTIATVVALTRKPSQTYAEYINGLSGNEDALRVKEADLLVNMSNNPELQRVSGSGSSLQLRYEDALNHINQMLGACYDSRTV